jgi:hypothetical protein
VTLYYDPADGSEYVFLAMCKNHIPPPYYSLLSGHGILNTGVPAGGTTLNVDIVYLNDYNLVKTDPDGRLAPEITTATCTSVAAVVSDTAVLATNKLRLGASVFNDSTAILYLKLGTGASTTSFTVKMAPGSLYELPSRKDGLPYNGPINGYWSVANGNARVTEVV